MSNKRIIGKMRTQTNQNKVVQKIVTIPKQRETMNWNKGDLIIMEKVGEIKSTDSTNNKKEETKNDGTTGHVRNTNNGITDAEHTRN